MEKQYSKVLQTLRDLGHGARDGSSVLDFGCGSGRGVIGLRERGYEAYGCDLKFGEEGDIPALARHGHVRLIETAPYRIPFDDDFFDIVYSCQVFEHVQNDRDVLREIHRVLAPGGVSLHIFPSRYRPDRISSSHTAGEYHPAILVSLFMGKARDQERQAERDVAGRGRP